MQRSYLPILVAVMLGLAGCSAEQPADEETATETPAPTGSATTDDVGEPTEAEATPDETASDGSAADADGDDLEFTTCEADDITVDYPDSWTVYEDADVPPCRVFHPEPIEDYVGESQHYAARLYIDPVEFEDATSTSNTLSEELSREETTVDGRDAVLTELESTGEAMLPQGERSYSYIVDLDGMILVGTTTSVGDTDYERDKQVLDRMMETLSVDVSES